MPGAAQPLQYSVSPVPFPTLINAKNRFHPIIQTSNMTPRTSKRIRSAVDYSEHSPDPEHFLNAAAAPATDDDRRKWQGWVEIESEPVRRVHSGAFLNDHANFGSN